MAAEFQFDDGADFAVEHAAETLRLVPAEAGVLCLRGLQAGDQPYLTRTVDLRRRAMRLLALPEMTDGGVPVLSRRLNLRDRVGRIEWTAVGSDFEALLVLYRATAETFGIAEARRRLRLHTPYFLRLSLEQAHPRVYVTNRLGRRSLENTYGPFGSRAAAERYADALLDLFKLRRCHEDLVPYPDHPGCVYQEMKKCLAPCNLSCTEVEYANEANAVRAFLATSGESLLAEVARERDRASEEMDFERAAMLHERWTKVKAAAGMAGDLIRALPRLRAAIVQKAIGKEELDAMVFLLEGGTLIGPERLSTLGVRAVREQTSVGSSLFAQPLMLAAVPLQEGPTENSPSEGPEMRATRVLARLEEKASATGDPAMMSDHLALLRRWFYRPEKQREGEIFFPNEDGSWPVRRVLRGAARMALGAPGVLAETDREGLAKAEMRVLHEGREGVERMVPALGKARSRRKQAEQRLPGTV